MIEASAFCKPSHRNVTGEKIVFSTGSIAPDGRFDAGTDPPQANVAVAACPLTAEQSLRRRVVLRFSIVWLPSLGSCILMVEMLL